MSQLLYFSLTAPSNGLGQLRILLSSRSYEMNTTVRDAGFFTEDLSQRDQELFGSITSERK